MLHKLWKVGLGAVGTAGLVALTASPAAASDFEAFTYGLTGSIEFIDYGRGQEGGGNNDDYFWVHDYSSADHDGVKAWVWVDGVLKGSKYNGRGASAGPVFWDPVQITGRHTIGVKVCNVNGNAGTPYNCHSHEHVEDG